MITTEKEALNTITTLGLPKALIDIWSGPIAPVLDSSWSRPKIYFECAEQLAGLVPGLQGLCPIVEQNGEAVIGVIPYQHRYVRFYYEDAREGDQAIEELGRGYQQFAMSLLLELADSGLNEEEFAEAARLLNFDHAERLWALCVDNDDSAIDELFESLEAPESYIRGTPRKT